MPTELKLCQPEEIVIIQVGGERVSVKISWKERYRAIKENKK